jgi:uncharacterized membrane protein YhaH (DUF805 family)
MSFGQAIKSVFRQYATFSGRARRAEYWWFYLFSILVNIPTQVFFFAMYLAAFIPALSETDANGSLTDEGLDSINWGLFIVGLIPMVVVSLGLLIPSLAVLVRRLHDTGRSGLWLLIGLVPGASIVLLIFAVLEGQPYDNAYGPDPKAGERYMGPGYGQPQQYGQSQPYAQPPNTAFPPPPSGPIAQPPTRPDDPFSAPGR